MALKAVAENLKRELSGLVDDIYLNETAVSATFADGEAIRETAPLLSELKSVTAECVQGRRDFSEKVGESRREASENLVSILKKEISFLTRKLNWELGERQNLKSRIAQLEGERLVLEEQSRRIEQDIQEASERNAKLEVAMGKTKLAAGNTTVINRVRNNVGGAFVGFGTSLWGRTRRIGNGIGDIAVASTEAFVEVLSYFCDSPGNP